MLRALTSPADLQKNPEWRVFDCRHDLSSPEKGRSQYVQEHIQGALHAHLDDDLSGEKTGMNGRHPLPSAGAFVSWLEQRGVRSTDHVVAYDDSGGIYAARLWWMLRWVGHPSAAVLDGGWAAWLRSGGAITTAIPTFDPSVYRKGPAAVSAVTVDEVERVLSLRTAVILDARGKDRFLGRNETIDPVAGHIPGAVNRPYLDNLDERGVFKPREVLAVEFSSVIGATRPEKVIHQCGSGVTACHNLLAMEIAGLAGSKLYPGSWSEWCSVSSRPIARGV